MGIFLLTQKRQSDIRRSLTGFDGLFAFTFDGNSDEFTGDFTPSVNGSLDYVGGLGGRQAAKFDGTQYIDLPIDSRFSLTRFTFSFFMKYDSISDGYEAILEHDRLGTNWYGFFKDAIIDERMNFRYQNSSALVTSAFLNLDWFHVIVTATGTTAQIYIDGILESTVDYTETSTVLDSIRIGRNQDNGESFTGYLQNLAFWDRGMTPTEVGDIYSRRFSMFSNQPISSPTILLGLRAAYEFEDTDSTFTDSFGSLNGVSVNTVSTGSINGNSLYYDIGDEGYSSVLSGSHAGEFEMTGSNAVTMMVDIYPTANGGGATSNIAGLFITTLGNHIYHLGYRSDNTIRGRIYTTSNTDVITTATAPLNQWSRIMLRWEQGDNIRVSISGSADAVGSVISGDIASDTLGIGFQVSMAPWMSGYINRQFQGRVDNLMIWERKLTDEERDQLFTGNPTYSELISS